LFQVFRYEVNRGGQAFDVGVQIRDHGFVRTVLHHARVSRGVALRDLRRSGFPRPVGFGARFVERRAAVGDGFQKVGDSRRTGAVVNHDGRLGVDALLDLRVQRGRGVNERGGGDFDLFLSRRGFRLQVLDDGFERPALG